ncbi:MAG: type II secretion system protein [Synergistaceae bacterium]|jgi:prepilin-type N-terminal cleavage/methylation domain-containing protein|nr:type II secretion system protein [Synergistaceae bacterium]
MKKAFTLVEVMIVAGIAGIIMVAGIAPLMYSVRLMSETRASFTEESRERTAINRMILDVRDATSAGEPRPFRLLHRDALSGPEDYLVLWTLTPSYSRLPLSAVVFGMPPESVLQGDYEKGLYRWLLSDDKRPEEVTMDDLVPERGRLVLAGVENVEFKVLSDRDWVDEYSGGIPQALRVVLKYGKEADGSGEERVRNYDVWLPRH